jgi:hypothetical protein
MKKKTYELIDKLKKHYVVYEEGSEFKIDDLIFKEYKDRLVVNTNSSIEKIPHELSEVEWWVNSSRDY